MLEILLDSARREYLEKSGAASNSTHMRRRPWRRESQSDNMRVAGLIFWHPKGYAQTHTSDGWGLFSLSLSLGGKEEELEREFIKCDYS